MLGLDSRRVLVIHSGRVIGMRWHHRIRSHLVCLPSPSLSSSFAPPWALGLSAISVKPRVIHLGGGVFTPRLDGHGVVPPCPTGFLQIAAQGSSKVATGRHRDGLDSEGGGRVKYLLGIEDGRISGCCEGCLGSGWLSQEQDGITKMITAKKEYRS